MRPTLPKIPSPQVRSFFIFYFLFPILLTFAIPAAAQQSPQFSQYTFNGLAINPAYAGYKEDLTARLSYRTQWTGLDGAPRTGTVSVDGLLDNRNKKMGVGLLAINDRLGPQTLSAVYANYAYRLKMDEDDTRRLCFGAAFGIAQYNLDASVFLPTDIVDNILPAGDQSKLIPDIRAGIYYSSSSAYVGLSAINLLAGSSYTSGNNLVKQVRHFYLTAGGMVPLGLSFGLKPSILLKEEFNGPTNLDICNYLAIKKTLWVGASYRCGVSLWTKSNLQNDLDKQDALALLAQVFWNNKYRFGYSFDFTTSSLSGYQNGSHEVSLSISFPGKKERIMSPRFF